jgi:hypothetical protein
MRIPMNRHLFTSLVLCLTLAATGCSSNCTIKGQIVFPDGSPVKELNGGGVSFESVASNYSAISRIDSDGRFDLYSIKAGDGVRPGKYRVAISPPMQDMRGVEAGKRLPPSPNPILSKYSSGETSGLEIVIDKSMSDLKLTVEPASSAGKK